MTRPEIEAFLSRRQEAWNHRDVAALTADHAEACVVESPMFGKLHGKGDIERSYRELFTVFESWDFQGAPAIIDSNKVALPFTSRATHAHDFLGVPPTNRRFETHGVLIYTLDPHGAITHEQRIYDFSGLLIQIGVLKARPK